MKRLLTILAHVLAGVFGHWAPPPWVRTVGRGGARTGAWAWAHKLKSGALVLAVVAAGIGGSYGWHWWKNRPKPALVQVHAFPPGLTAIGDKSAPRPLRLEFSASSAPLKAVGTALKKGITVEPKLDGIWKWVSDRELELRPKDEWPIGQKFTVRLDRKGLVASHIKLSTYEVEFATAPFVVNLREAEFYQDPADPNLKKIVSEFGFTHPVDGPSFEKNIRMRFEPSNKEERAFDLDAHA